MRETKEHFRISGSAGVLLFVNDGFATLGPDLVRSLACSLLMNSYSSIDAFVYLTVNRYVEIQGSDVPRLVWAPSYCDRATDELLEFVNDLGRKWFKFLEAKIGPFTVDKLETDDPIAIRGSKSIVLLGENRSKPGAQLGSTRSSCVEQRALSRAPVGSTLCIQLDWVSLARRISL